MKKYILLFIAVLTLSSCVNKESLKEEISQEIKEELLQEVEKQPIIEKGSGFIFYNEMVSIGGSEYFVHHSTLNCPAIKNGVQLNCYKLNAYHNLFCSKCMDVQLIGMFNNNYFPKGYK